MMNIAIWNKIKLFIFVAKTMVSVQQQHTPRYDELSIDTKIDDLG